MIQKLTDNQREAIRQHGSPLPIEDDETGKVYVIVDEEFHQRATKSLEEQDARRAIRAGIKDLEAGRVVPFADIDRQLRQKLGLPARTS